jgi:nickel/cobalt transporter (NicO) family protein
MNNGLLATLVVAAATVGSLHTMAPDHWMPFAALARARKWGALRTARTTILCGFGHVTVSAALGIAALFVGLGVIKAIGSHLENQANWLLMAFGTVYMIWGFWHRGHHHHDHPHDHDHGLTEWSLFLLFCADPCVAVIPMIMAAASGGWTTVAAVVITYEIATIATMVVLVAGAHAGVRSVRSSWIDRYGHAAAGALIVSVGAAMALLGI